MLIVQLAAHLLIMWLAFRGAIFVREILPFGERVQDTLVSPTSLIILLLVWAGLFGLRIWMDRTRQRGDNPIFLLATAAILSLAEYFVLGLDNQSLSRLFLPVLLLTNALGLVASWHLYSFLAANWRSVTRSFSNPQKGLASLETWAHQYHGELVAGLLVGLTWAAYVLKMGLNLTSDSEAYMGFAVRVFAGGQFDSTSWPPLYPFSIALTRFLTAFPADGAAIISAICIVGVFVFFALALRQFSRHTLLNILFILILGSVQNFIGLFHMAWSEQPYTLLLIGSYFFMVRHHFTQKYAYFGLAIVFAALGMIARYIGVAMGGVLILYALLLSQPGASWLARIRNFVLPSFLAFAPFAYQLWLDTLRRTAATSVPVAAQIEEGEIFVYPLGFNSVIYTVQEFLRSYWQNTGYVYLALLLGAVVLAVLILKNAKRDVAWPLKVSLFFFGAYFAGVVGVINITNRFPVPRYWISLIFLVLVLFAQVISVSLDARKKLFGKSFYFDKVPLLLAALAVVIFAQQSSWARGMLVDEVIDARTGPVHHSSLGFNVSPTAAGLSDFFADISSTKEENTIVLIDGDVDRRVDAYTADDGVGRTFLYKSAVIASPALDGFKFFSVPETSEQHFSYAYLGEHRVVNLFVPDLIAAVETLDQEQNTLGESEGLYLIFNLHLMENADVLAFLDQLTGYQQIEEIDPYVVYRYVP
jgi:hypothetical protein